MADSMELSRTEYPGILTSVRPLPAVKLLRERMHKGQTLNTEIADWLQERRKAEEAYAQALTKLCKRPTPGDSSELGVFAGPWARIVESTSNLATAHHQYAQKVDLDVEKPIREFVSRNGDWSGMKALEGNLSTLAKAIDTAEERAEKLRKRGAKAKAQQLAESINAVNNALAEWDSQAPFVFEKFQAADESRCNGLRDALTRLQTLEVDQGQSMIQAAESSLSVVLDISTSDEVKAFTNKATAGREKIERQTSRTGSRSGPGLPSTPSIVTDDSVSVQSSHSGGGAISTGNPGPGLGLKRLGTVLRSRNRNSIFHRSASPDKRGERQKAHPPLPHSLRNTESPISENNSLAVPTPSSPPGSSNANTPHILEQNGTSRATGQADTPSVTITSDEPQKDAEGYSIPPPNHDHMKLEEAEEPQPQFKVEIKNDVIQEEEEEADAAMSKVANTLRAQNTVSRKSRGRRDARDVRNTVFFPSPPPELTEQLTGSSPPLTPMKIITPRPSNVASEAGSDTQSIKSSRSITSLGTAVIKHPDLTEAGLSCSLIESVSSSFEGGQVTRSIVSGEIALAYHDEASGDALAPLNIRLDNFSVLEKVAPNPAFITAVPDAAGEYTLNPAGVRKTSVAFKYQLHLDDNALSIYCPIVVTAVWRIESHQSSVIVNWKSNPAYKFKGKQVPFTLRNTVFVTGVEGITTSSCQSKPVGTFVRDKGRLVWKLGDLTVDPNSESSGGKMLARFATDGTARPSAVDVRWEISGEDADIAGSSLVLSVQGDAPKSEEEADPFADTSGEERSPSAMEMPLWGPVPVVRRIISGKYSTH